ncbi:hypothetical protein C0995_015082 [Termitomyces sp. Mi166|nr:hypothetical protein C0995_015082 [Termitomyces sp. Mi166\
MSKFNFPLFQFSFPFNTISTHLWSHRARLRFLTIVVACVLLLVHLRFVDSSTPTHPVKAVSDSDSYKAVVENPLKETRGPRILLVSALFPLTHAKHTHEDYISWLRNFIGRSGIQSDVYFYTTPELASLVSSLHSSTSTSPTTQRQRLTINTTYTSPFSIPPLARYTSKYHAMHAWDRERARHNPELYAVWNAKPWLLEYALISLSSSTSHSHSGSHESHGEYDYDYAFWVDAGSFRAPHPFRRWPDPRRVDKVFSAARYSQEGNKSDKDKDKMLIPLYGVPGLKEYAWRFEMGPVDMDLSEARCSISTDIVQELWTIENWSTLDLHTAIAFGKRYTGSFFGSTPRGISWFSKTFYETHDWYINTSPPVRSALHPHLPSGFLLTNHKTNMKAPFHFVGKDQTVINAIILRYPERFVGVIAPSRVGLLPPSTSTTLFLSPSQNHSSKPHILTLSSILTRLSHSLPIFHPKTCGDWFFYQWFLASDREREEAGRGGCPRASASVSGEKGREVVDIESMLRGLFGGRWVEGRRAGGA